MLLAVDYSDNRVHIDETHSNHDIIMLPAARWLNCFTRFNRRGSVTEENQYRGRYAMNHVMDGDLSYE